MLIKLAMRWPAPARFSSSCYCSLSCYAHASIGFTNRAYIATTTSQRRRPRHPPRRGQRRQIHVLKLWLYALALVLFFGGWLAWKNDLNGTWGFKRDSPLYWLQGHAVWHVLTMGALGCIYWFFRSERLVE